MRCVLAGVAAVLFGWALFEFVSSVAASLGLITSLHHNPAISEWILISESWQQITITSELTDVGWIVAIFSTVMASYIARIVYRNDMKILDRRARWIINGWSFGCLLSILQTVVVDTIYRSAPFLENWRTLYALVSGFLLLALVSAFARCWSWVMRVCKVPASGIAAE